MSRITDEMLAHLESSADALVRAAVREIDRMIREGASMQEILDMLKTFRLPTAQAAKLQSVLDDMMNEIVTSRGSVVKELSDADILDVKAAAKISFLELRTSFTTELIPTVQRAIAARMGPDALRHVLKQKGFSGPRTLAYTSLSQFNNELTFATAEITGTNNFLYSGAITDVTRDYCREHAGNIYTLEEIDLMDNGQGLSVRSSCGGYNCRHSWVAQPD